MNSKKRAVVKILYFKSTKGQAKVIDTTYETLKGHMMVIQPYDKRGWPMQTLKCAIKRELKKYAPL